MIGSSVYILIMLKLLFLRAHYLFADYNLVPFKTINAYIVNRDHYNTDILIKNLFGNIVLFIPMGFIIPLLNRNSINFWRFLTCSFLILLAVELTQLITRVGSLDIDDIILNMFGAIIGFGITKILIISFSKDTRNLMDK
ncbi:VanZ family protein [Paenibacillus roseipurpureus]|uniref:VanZ family protein n=2 Tax=Paenibacillus roseopurpureus TaxID=2918901 RepID=A0AA96LVP4_9BACL|nr:VanZ family protein [Paenibacillus sp. MBLB1832]